MKREIKFRMSEALSEASKMFYDTEEVMECLKQQILFDSGNTSLGYDHIGDGNAFMQFTGLKDKNGKDIYEGDFLNIGSGSFGIVTNANGELVKYEVRADGCDYILFRNDIQLVWGRLGRIAELSWDCQITGNIYENPELLKK